MATVLDRHFRFAFLWAMALSLALPSGLGHFGLALAAPSNQALSPVYWKQRLFYIPYQVNRQSGELSNISKVQLLVLQGTTNWRTLQEAATNVQGFTYHAPNDGEYWFALRHLDQQGNSWPSTAIQPQMRIVIDTVKPEVQLRGELGDSGQVVVRYEANDLNLRPESLQVEARMSGGLWSAVRIGPPASSQPEFLQGQATWTIPIGAKAIEFRASIADKAGNQAQATTEVAVAGPSLQTPKGNKDLIAHSEARQSNGATIDPFQAAGKLAYQDWPASNRLAARPGFLANSGTNSSGMAIAKPQPNQQTPPLRNPYTVARDPGTKERTPAQLLGNTKPNTQTPLESPNGLVDTSSPQGLGWQAPPSPLPATDVSDRMVNSLTFDVEYDLQSVGPWGVSKVELWGTHDDGQTWQSYGVDSDNRSPVRVTVPGEGIFGFRILVDGANGVAATPPRSGEQPELVVAVDLQAPRAELLSAELGRGNLADHLILQWSATDKYLDPRPVGLFYSTHPNGPWSTIASGLENTGAYTWRLQRHMPDRFFVRLEARDLAGNLATHQSPEPVTLSRPQPTGRLRSVRPVASPGGF